MARIMIIGSGLIARELESLLRSDGHKISMCSAYAYNLYKLQYEAVQSDLIVLCCKPKETKEIVDQIPKGIKILDTSYNYRTDSEWVYGLRELYPHSLVGADRVANAGCIATGVILLLKPLRPIQATREQFLINVSCGASAGGAMMLQEARKGKLPEEYMKMSEYDHPHVPEIKKHLEMVPYSNVVIIPKIVSAVDHGMRVEIMLWGQNYFDVLNLYHHDYSNNKNIDIVRDFQYIPVTVENAHKATIYVNKVAGGVMVICTFDNLRYAGVDNIKRNIKMMLNLNQGGM